MQLIELLAIMQRQIYLRTPANSDGVSREISTFAFSSDINRYLMYGNL